MGEKNRAARNTRKQAILRKTQRRHSHFYAHCTHWSLSQHEELTPIHWRRERWMLAGTAALVAALSGFIMPAWATAMKPATHATLQRVVPLVLPIVSAANPLPAAEDWHSVQVLPGQSLSDVFQAQGFSMTDLQRVLDNASDSANVLRHLKPGDEFEFMLGPGHTLQGIRFDKDDSNRVTLRFDGDKALATIQPRAIDRREHVAHAVIEGSLFAAGSKAGLDDAMVLKLAELFKYDIDFAQDLRVGDSFTLIYDDIYRDGQRYGEGNIVAAEFVNQGKRYTAYRFKKADGSYGWFSEDGRPVQKSFLRIPVDFTRISSTFSAARFHPILGLMRAHKGVDYAAPTGTPIHAAGDGTIKFKGWMNGYGNFVIIQHDKDISTAYGHMSRFASERVGQHVMQGQVIGFVGMTGLATGPHLHYEFRVDGTQRNPQTVTLPKPEPLPAAQLAQFEATVVKPQWARLSALDASIQLAKLDHVGHSDD